MFSIFNLSGQDAPPQDPVVQNANQPGEGSVDPTGSLTPSAGDSGKKEPMIVLDGPLGHMYTQALNLAYAKEDTGMMSMAYQNYRNQVKEVDGVDANGTYVYAVDGSNMNQGGVLAATKDIQLAIAGKVFKHHVLVMEHHGIPNSKAQLLVEYAKGVGMKVIEKRTFSQESMKMALESLGHTFKA
jgi:hypothetical protein